MTFFNTLFNAFFGPVFLEWFERNVIRLAIIGFVFHTVFLVINHLQNSGVDAELNSWFYLPVKAIFTPFSIIILYEIYQFLVYLHRSFTTSILKQFEIISLILIRKIFKDLSEFRPQNDWYKDLHHQEILGSLIGLIVILSMVYLFNLLISKKPKVKGDKELSVFITTKRIISVVLIPILFIILVYQTSQSLVISNGMLAFFDSLQEISFLFFQEFFLILIFIDVLILLISFYYSNVFSKLIRNTGFVISTVILRISFETQGLATTILIIVSIVFSLFILFFYNQINKVIPTKV